LINQITLYDYEYSINQAYISFQKYFKIMKNILISFFQIYLISSLSVLDPSLKNPATYKATPTPGRTVTKAKKFEYKHVRDANVSPASGTPFILPAGKTKSVKQKHEKQRDKGGKGTKGGGKGGPYNSEGAGISPSTVNSADTSSKELSSGPQTSTQGDSSSGSTIDKPTDSSTVDSSSSSPSTEVSDTYEN
jgi:hypothetical protein